METVLYRSNPWWTSDFSMPGMIERIGVFRDFRELIKTRQIIFLTGLRWIGKTTLMKMTIAHMINKQGVDPKKILYVSLDDYLLGKNSILEIIEEFRKIHRLRYNEHVYLFLDEIAYKQDFDIQLKNLYDQQHVKIFASSSSASLLKNRKAFLTGRHRVFELNPLDFREYLLFKGIGIIQQDSHLTAGLFEDFLKAGGIPEFVVHNETMYLQDLVDDILVKDIAAVYGIRDIRLLKDYFLLLMERSGKVISINKIASILKISPDTAKRYLELFADTYLIYLVSRYGKINERILAPKKIYAADTGIRTLFCGFKDKGSLFENYIYLQLRKYNPEYIYREGIEIDFFIGNKTLIEVKYHPEVLEARQQSLFDTFIAKEKIIIRSHEDLERWMAG